MQYCNRLASMAIGVLAAVHAARGDESKPEADAKPNVELAPHKDQAKTKGRAKIKAEAKAESEARTKARAKATSEANADAQAKAKPARPNQKVSDEERQEAAIALAREHHPDLVELLERLKATKPNEYQQAIKELYRDSQRLENLRQRDPERYALDLRAWQLDSRLRLLTARLSLEDRPELEADLKAALAQRSENRMAQKTLERDRLSARLKKLDADISALTDRREEMLQRNFDRLLRAAKKARPAKAVNQRDEPQRETSP